MWIWDQVQPEALVARRVSLEVGEQRGTIWAKEDSPSHLLLCLGHVTLEVGRPLPQGEVAKTVTLSCAFRLSLGMVAP